MSGLGVDAVLDLIILWRGWIVAGLHVVVAGLVSVHVLLRKQDVGYATAWIGLAWLSPFFGGAFYFLLGINRVQRRARGLRGGAYARRDSASLPEREFGDRLAPLNRLAQRVSGRTACAGNRIVKLHNGDEAYPRMLAAIEAAEVSVTLSTYIFRDDAAGRPFIDALVRAQERGVDVRVLIDGVGGGYFTSHAYRRLRARNVPAARFMHSLLPWRMPFLNLRLHKKSLIIDGVKAFAGGLNIGAENLSAAGPDEQVLDHHFLIEGPVVAQLAEAFARDWALACGETIETPVAPQPSTPPGDHVMRVLTAGPDEDVEKIETVALMAIACAKSSICIQTPYFLPGARLVSALALAALRGVSVDIVAPARSNHPMVDSAMRAHVEPLLQAGCRLWRDAPPFDHSKLMSVDGEWALIGSSNWDVRSFRLNFELCVEVYSVPFAHEIEALIAANRDEALTLEGLARRTMPQQLRDAACRLLLPYL